MRIKEKILKQIRESDENTFLKWEWSATIFNSVYGIISIRYMEFFFKDITAYWAILLTFLYIRCFVKSYKRKEKEGYDEIMKLAEVPKGRWSK